LLVCFTRSFDGATCNAITVFAPLPTPAAAHQSMDSFKFGIAQNARICFKERV
jgi:hypothetical protein